MESLPQITFRHLPHSDAVEDAILKRIGHLEKLVDRIISCRVIMERPQRRRSQGDLYHLRIDVRVPGKELIVNREPALHQAHEDAYVAIRDAFDAMERQIEEYVRRRRREVKRHEEPTTGFVTYLNQIKDYGFIQSSDGHEVYFHRNSLIGYDFDDLLVGDHLRFDEEDGARGPQASSVHFLHHESLVRL